MGHFSWSMQATTGQIWRLCLVVASAAALAIAMVQPAGWLEDWDTRRAALVLAAVGLSTLTVYLALRASGRIVKRVVMEGIGLACALLTAEAVLLLLAPEKWFESPLAQRIIAREEAALHQGINFDRRLRAEVVRELRSQGRTAVPGFAQGMAMSSAAVASGGPRDLLPLSNVGNTDVVECNEGPGYLTFHSDEFGFNNPPGLGAGPLDIAVFGASLALGHCVPQASSVVALLRARYPRTATFGTAGSRVLTQLAAFREYVQPVKPGLVVWLVDTNVAVAREEARRPVLLKYLHEPSFSQQLRSRQAEVDSFVQDILVPLSAKQDETLAIDLDRARRFPVGRLMRLREVRSVIGYESVLQRQSPAPDDLSHFEAAIDRVVEAVAGWGGELLVVVAPSYHLARQAPANVARYRAVLQALSSSGVSVVDGVSLFDAEPDPIGLFNLRIDSHPNERGHSLLANAVVATIERQHAVNRRAP